MSDTPTPIRIYVDADACPVKDEIYRVTGRHRLPVFVVTNSFVRVPQDSLIERVAVAAGPDAADDWIAERADASAIVITADISLADRCVKAGARRRDRAKRTGIHKRFHRHGAGVARPDDGFAFGR